MISVITIYNDKNVLESTLLKSIKVQENCEYETILVDTYSHGFTSAASALNYGASLAKGDYLVFIHQDVKFEENELDWAKNNANSSINSSAIFHFITPIP